MKRFAFVYSIATALLLAATTTAATFGTIQVDETVPSNHRVEFTVTNDTSAVVEWFAVQTGNPMDWSSTAPGWDYDLIFDYREATWPTLPIGCEFCPVPPTSYGLDLDKTWIEVTGLTFGQFMAAGGFDPVLGVFVALPVTWDPVAPTYTPANGLAPGESLGGFIVEGLPGSEFLARLSTGELVSGPIGQPIVVGPGPGSVPEPGTAALLTLGLAAVGRRRRGATR